MATFNEKNYLMVNSMADAAEKDWCFSGMYKTKMTQATVKLEKGKSFQYATRFPVAEGDVVVVGNTLAQTTGAYTEQSSNSGRIGTVVRVDPKLTINRNHAVELDFVFTPAASKKAVKDCVKYFNTEDVYQSMQFGKFLLNAFPITLYTRKMLLAASIVAHPNIADEESVNAAKAYIHEEKTMDELIAEWLTGPPEPPEISLSDTHIFTNGKSAEELESYDISDFLDAMRLGNDDAYYKELGIANTFFNKYVFMGSISIMVRGGFVNLLEAFLSAEPPIKDFYDEMIGYLGDAGNDRALKIIKEYEPAR